MEGHKYDIQGNFLLILNEVGYKNYFESNFTKDLTFTVLMSMLIVLGMEWNVCFGDILHTGKLG